MDGIEELRYLILAAQREGNRALAEALRPHRLTPSQAEVVAVLRDSPRPLTLKELGDRLVCERGSPSRLVRTLVDRGLVDSSPHEHDGRATRLRLTSNGLAAARAVTTVEQQLYALLGSALDHDQARVARDLLRSFADGLPSGQALARRIADREHA